MKCSNASTRYLRSKAKSDQPQNLGTPAKLSASKNLYIKLHGSFMIAAWVFFASIGMFLARYFKQGRRNSPKLAGMPKSYLNLTQIFLGNILG
jgi:hypothetical protein